MAHTNDLRVIDLRSDTVTRPDSEMRRAMAEAEVGDDVYGEDPTVRRLEERAAEVIGHEAALFVPTGTMGNQIALHLHGSPGSEVVCDRRSHLVDFEMGAMAALSGLFPRTVESPGGRLEPGAVDEAVVGEVPFASPTGVIAVENTVNMAGGLVLDLTRIEDLLEVARRHELPIHLDGARIFNAAVALDLPVDRLARGFDSVMFCLSKGLGAPVGSLLCGSRELMAKARRVRKMFGGGMRQVGVLAAAGLVALDHGPARLQADHHHARLLAGALSRIPWLETDPGAVETNIVTFAIADSFSGPRGDEEPISRFLARARGVGVLASPALPGRGRFVTHRDVGREEVEAAVERLARLGGG